MIYRHAQEVADEAAAYLGGVDRKGNPHELNIDKGERLANDLLANSPMDPHALYIYAGALVARRRWAPALIMYLAAVEALPNFPEAWNNLGMCWQALGHQKAANRAFHRAFEISPIADVACNIAANHINVGHPEVCLEWAERALDIDPNHGKAKWHRALGHLELWHWAEGWDDHEVRLQGFASSVVAERNYSGDPDHSTPMWNGKSKGFVVIHGEEGMGDEIMFGTCIEDAVMASPKSKFLIEPSPRLHGLFKRSLARFPNVTVYGTNDVDGRGWIKELGPPDYKCPIGSLPRFYRRSLEAFPGTPWLSADLEKAAYWRGRIKAVGRPGKPKIGLAWSGGVHQTFAHLRSLVPPDLAPILALHDHADFYSLQYDPKEREHIKLISEQLGVRIHHIPAAVECRHPDTDQPSDLDELAAFISGLDLIITVCQTVVHVAGALGKETWCLTPSQPSWRYGAVDSDRMPWYMTVRQERQKPGEEWEHVTTRIQAKLAKWLAKIQLEGK